MWKNVSVWEMGEGKAPWQRDLLDNLLYIEGIKGETWRNPLTSPERLEGKETHPAGRLPLKQLQHTRSEPQNADSISKRWEIQPWAVFSCVTTAGLLLMAWFHYYLPSSLQSVVGNNAWHYITSWQTVDLMSKPQSPKFNTVSFALIHVVSHILSAITQLFKAHPTRARIRMENLIVNMLYHYLKKIRKTLSEGEQDSNTLIVVRAVQTTLLLHFTKHNCSKTTAVISQ